MPLIYAFVARDTTVLAEYTPYTGNFNTVAIECLQKLSNPESKFTIACDRHTFNFLVHRGFSRSLSIFWSTRRGASRSTPVPPALTSGLSLPTCSIPRGCG